MADWPEPTEKMMQLPSQMQVHIPNMGVAHCNPQAWDEQLRSDDDIIMDGLVSQGDQALHDELL